MRRLVRCHAASTYHSTTDLPVIASGDKVAFLDPQEVIWRGESGCWYDLSQCPPDTVAPFKNICGFSAHMHTYRGTMFRFPLRNKPSELSKKLYTVDRLRHLLDALKQEAKFLLLFLRSVDTIEVFEIGATGERKVFEVAIVEKEAVSKQRKEFKAKLKSAHNKYSFSISEFIPLVLKFHVRVTEHMHTAAESDWLVVSRVGCSSAIENVLEAAEEQCVFPWVGVALEVKDGTPSPSGRIFCFLPMPEEATCHLPVHVNGTFGLDKDRRALKWPSIERKDDLQAKWNVLLVEHLLPPCYAILIVHAMKLLKPEKLYEVWPAVDVVQPTPWRGLLLPLFRILFNVASIRTTGEWIKVGEGIFIPRGSKLVSVVHNTLSRCGLKLVTIPPRIWDALGHSNRTVREVSPQLARAVLNRYPDSYSGIDSIGKLELLRYCLSDRAYSDLHGLSLLPLTDESFASFQGRHTFPHYFLCTEKCPRYLLPNLDSSLVDLPDDEELLSSLQELAKTGYTQLRELTHNIVAQLLPKSMPSQWQYQNTVSLPHPQFPSDWLEKFWEWVQKIPISTFAGCLIVPVDRSGSVSITRLNKTTPVVYIPTTAQCSPTMHLALEKLSVMCSLQSDFPYLEHQQLSTYLNGFNPKGVLDAIDCAFENRSNLLMIGLAQNEACILREFLSASYTATSQRLKILKYLPVFTTTSNSNNSLYSMKAAKSDSVLNEAVMQPEGFVFSPQYLPPNLILFSHSEYNQRVLLTHCGDVAFPNNFEFTFDFLLPLIKRRCFPDHLLDSIMHEMLNAFSVITLRVSYSKIQQLRSFLQNLPFLRTKSGDRQCPKDLYDPSKPLLRELFLDEPVFPTPPFDKEKYLNHLRSCGLRTSVQPQEIVNLIWSIGAPATSYPQPVDSTKLTHATAVLKYLSSSSCYLDTNVAIPNQRKLFQFKHALQQLATKKSWLPICPTPPAGYPSCLTWKGGIYTSHLASLNRDTVLVLSNEDASKLPFVIGSQMCIVAPTLPPEVANIFSTDTIYLGKNILGHFQKLISQQHQIINQRVMNYLVMLVYKYMHIIWQRGMHSQLQGLHSFDKWIWISRKQTFVSPKVVAVRKNTTFRQDLEPYLYILPNDLAPYQSLLTAYGVEQEITPSQIISVLGMIKDAQADLSQADEMWQIVMSILNWLTEHRVVMPYDETLYVPVESDSPFPVLQEARGVVYTDNEFVKAYLGSSVDSEQSYTFNHPRINPQMAHNLGLTPLSKELEISEDAFEDAGQSEPLTVRLKKLLRDYKDGLTIIKELLQNADDAEATEIDICYDARTHHIDPKSLFFKGMAECHGPALIVHNNCVFSDEDFVNITKLGGGTKENKPLKIGKFGVGFCSVYHITDIPSFVSRDNLFIFDPTLTYLRKEIKNPARPGKKVNLSSQFIARSNQLIPYAGLFGFKQGTSYQGTMFRFPFRKHASELSSTTYTEDTITDLIRDIQTSSSKLLLFLQHVRCVTFHRIDQGQHSPTCLLRITKDELHGIPHSPAKVIEVKCSKETAEHWLVASDTDSFRDRRTTASVACSLQKNTRGRSTYTLQEIAGDMFCFLPLSLQTGLPVHVSSNFAVINNRRGIWTSDEASSKTDFEVQWNEQLMRTVIPRAFFHLLTALQAMQKEGKLQDYEFYSLWPLERKLNNKNPWLKFLMSVYEMIHSSDLFYSSCTSQWLSIEDSKFLSQDGILCRSSDVTIPECVRAVVEHLKLPVVYLPSDYHDYLYLDGSTITEKDFVKKFFQNIDSLGTIQESRNEVLQHMLEDFAIELDNYQHENRMSFLRHCLTEHACVPCTPDGCVLRKGHEVIDPETDFARLYDEKEHMFPIPEFFRRHLVATALDELGMIGDFIPWALLIERAKSVHPLYKTHKNEALERIKLILQCIATNMKEKHKQPGIAGELAGIPFLPVLPKPKHYPLPWFGEDHQFLSGKDLIVRGTHSHGHRQSDVNVYIAGSQVAIVNEEKPENGGCGYVPYTSQQALQIRQSPKLSEVVRHLKQAISTFTGTMYKGEDKAELVKWTDSACRQSYDFLESQINFLESQISQHQPPSSSSPTPQAISHQTIDLQGLQQLRCVWTGTDFIEPQLVAVKSTLKGPYLFALPHSLTYKTNLAKALGIKDKFSPEDIVGALRRMKNDFGNEPVDKRCQEFLKYLLLVLQAIEPSKELGDIMLPDTEYVMHKASALAYNDTPWCPPEEEYIFVNDIIPRELARKLNVKTVRSKRLDRYASSATTHFQGVPFGQGEKLTQRIQNILREYPFDVTVLKELLQNADDAKANKMYVILDKRTHGQERVLSEEWKDLQGPALLVWNDSTFSEKDLEGIQRLGLGNKRSDAESIGQYGIGFNVVYHLTDCPSFISGGETETLCIMDPHCRYVPGADALKPGRRLNLESRFWDDFPDLRSAYLRDGVKDCPAELSGGSLFRFPLRHIYDLIKKSEIIDNQDGDARPLSAERMHIHLRSWVPQMKKNLLFLKHVTELKFLVIEEDSEVIVTEHHFEVHLDESAQAERGLLQRKLTAFKKDCGSEPFIVRYPMTITECHPRERAIAEAVKAGTRKTISSTTTEKWLIQQGIGDIEDDMMKWTYIDRVKPRHGLAAPLNLPENKLAHFSGDVFCFLPLPISSNLPVHVNGHFILDSSRRALWKSTIESQKDERSQWNENLLTAIASSYAKLLINARRYYVHKDAYEDENQLERDISRYYNIFPNWSHSIPTRPVAVEDWLRVAEEVYRKLGHHNAPILATISTKHSPRECGKVLESTEQQSSSSTQRTEYSVQWHRLFSTDAPSSQIYFWCTHRYPETKPLLEDAEVVKPILERIGMKIACAPLRIRNHLNKMLAGQEEEKAPEGSPAVEKIPITSPSTVFEYYTKFYRQAAPGHDFPCSITDTEFQSINDFKVFTKYLLQYCSAVTESGREFPGLPFGYPLLLTADGQLRVFNKNHKVISSKFTLLFPQSSNQFLHPELLDVSYRTTYFVSEDCVNYIIIHSILANDLPRALHTCAQRVTDANDHISKETLKQLWECFTSDPVFRSQVENILTFWALLLTTEDELYNCASTDRLLPVIPPSQDEDTPHSDEDPDTSDLDSNSEVEFDESIDKVYKVLQSLHMPFLATDVVSSDTVTSFCPKLSNNLTDCAKLLTNLLCLHKEVDISTALGNEDIECLVHYFKMINFRTELDSRNVLHSLPLFLSISGNFTTIVDKVAYIWPDKVDFSGYDKWQNDTNVVFLDNEGYWTNLDSASNLDIENITAEEIYIRYIFPRFGRLNYEERFQHLMHIRDNLLEMNQFNVKSKSVHAADKQKAQSFLDALKALPCIGRDGERLKCASEFCDDTNIIFTTFQEHIHFCFLPDYFREETEEGEEWLKFFIAIGTKDSITQQKFTDFSSLVARGQHEEPKVASSVLLSHLFSKKAKEWHDDGSFLAEVSEIPFVCSKPLKTHSWIEPVCPTQNHIQPFGEETIHLTTLRGAALPEHSDLVWTVKPIIPLSFDTFISESYSYYTSVLEMLQVVIEPEVADVIQNIVNISNSRFASFKLFDQYPQDCKPPSKHSKGLIEVMLSNFKFLHDHPSPSKQLSSLPCIPVYANPASRFRTVLVTPSHVLTGVNMGHYHPFLHSLPNELLPISSFLEGIGVKTSLELNHLRIALELVFQCSNGVELDVNTNNVVKYAIQQLNIMLKSSHSVSDIATALRPLYLPTTKGTLCSTSCLLYRDKMSYKNVKIDLPDTGSSLLDIPTTYEVLEDEFCSLLPKEVRPRGLSECCEQRLSEGCIPLSADSPIAKLQRTTFKLENLPRAVMKIIRHQTKDKSLCESFEPVLVNFLQRIEIFTVENLSTDVILNQNEKIGSAKVKFHLQEGQSCSFYLDAKNTRLMEDTAFESLADHLISAMKPLSTTSAFKLMSLQKILTMLLKAESQSDLHYVLNKEGILLESQDIQFEAHITPKLGETVPTTWLHRLDQNINLVNIFKPWELVGYEESEGRIIFAQIVYPILPEGVEEGQVSAVQMRYKIYTSENDEEGKTVRALDLYKFLRGLKASTSEPTDPEAKALMPFDEDSDAVRVGEALNQEPEDLKSIKEKLCRELRKIWQLPKEDRDKAIRRLYLKWHPDKNPDQPELAEEVFKFLRRQIERLERGLSLEDTDVEEAADFTPRGPSSYWSECFRQWDQTAQEHHSYWQSECNFQQTSTGDGSRTYYNSDDFDRPVKQPAEAKRWMRQANGDFKAVCTLFDQTSTFPELSGHVCFMAHQVAEKALKGGMYAVCGLTQNSLMRHNLTPLAYTLESEKRALRDELAKNTIPLESHYLDTRYPNRYAAVSITPLDRYTPQQAQEAKAQAKAILDMMNPLVEQ